MIDDKQVPDDLVDYILDASSLYRHLIRFVQTPNVRTAYALKIPENATNYDKVKTHYIITRIFIENNKV